MGKLDIEVLCFNFVAHFNWVRTRYDVAERGNIKIKQGDSYFVPANYGTYCMKGDLEFIITRI
jgi:D-mannonate dehydratase